MENLKFIDSTEAGIKTDRSILNAYFKRKIDAEEGADAFGERIGKLITPLEFIQIADSLGYCRCRAAKQVAWQKKFEVEDIRTFQNFENGISTADKGAEELSDRYGDLITEADFKEIANSFGYFA